jgi:hypothetical protein
MPRKEGADTPITHQFNQSHAKSRTTFDLQPLRDLADEFGVQRFNSGSLQPFVPLFGSCYVLSAPNHSLTHLSIVSSEVTQTILSIITRSFGQQPLGQVCPFRHPFSFPQLAPPLPISYLTVSHFAHAQNLLSESLTIRLCVDRFSQTSQTHRSPSRFMTTNFPSNSAFYSPEFSCQSAIVAVLLFFIVLANCFLSHWCLCISILVSLSLF